MSYLCNDCGSKFDRPKEITDDVNDETYYECRRCGSDNFEEYVDPIATKLNRCNKLREHYISDVSVWCFIYTFTEKQRIYNHIRRLNRMKDIYEYLLTIKIQQL